MNNNTDNKDQNNNLKLFSNEIVFRGHPDKVSDQISAAILKECVKQKGINARAGIECVGGKMKIFITGETNCNLSNKLVKNTVREQLRLCDVHDYKKYKIINNIGIQSHDISIGVDKGDKEIGAGDQGMMFGYACNDTKELLPLAQVILQKFAMWYDKWQNENRNHIYSDGKAQITGYYDKDFKLTKIKTFLISYQNSEKYREVYDINIKIKIREILKEYGLECEEILINPTGKFCIGGYVGDSGLCLEGNTLVATKKGLKKISELKIGEQVYTENGSANIIEFINNGVKDTHIIKTNNGQEINATLNHPFRVFDGEKIIWKKCLDLKIGDWLVRKKINHLKIDDGHYKTIKYKKKNKIHSIKVDKDFAYLLGWLIGDGCVSSDNMITFYFNHNCEDEKNNLRKILTSVFKDEFICEYPNNNPNDRFIICSQELVKVLREAGVLNTTSRTHEIPKCILESTDIIKKNFLSGLFDADGSIKTEEGRNEEYINICLSTTSKKLSQQVSTVLFYLGIETQIYENKREAELRDYGLRKGTYFKEGISYQVAIRGLNSIRKFLNEIGFRIPYKKEKYDNIVFKDSWHFKDFQKYPFYNLVNELLKLSTKKKDRYFSGLYRSGKKDSIYIWETITHILDMYSEFKDTIQYKKLKDLMNFEYVQIKSIQNDQCETFDITLDDDTHSFLANTFVVHNTGRKIVVDTYQGFANVGGGAFSGKDSSKVDLSGSYMARQIACEYLKKNNLKWCEVQLSYAIGKSQPLAIYIDSNKGNIEPTPLLYKRCEPLNIIKELDLLNIDYVEQAKFGHFRDTNLK